MEMRFHAASGTMRMVTKIERVQPMVSGVDANGELLWEGQAMPRFQMAMFPVAKYDGDFLGFWGKRRIYEQADIELDCINAEFRSYVPWELEAKYEAALKVRKGKGD